MNTLQLNCAINSDRHMKISIKGVYAADEINKVLLSRSEGIIVNSQTHYFYGEHWIVIYINEFNVLEYFDSFGKHPKYLSSLIWNFVKQYPKRVINDQRIQGTESTVCGQYCLFYLMCRTRGYTMQDIVKTFSNNYTSNDTFVYKFIDERFLYCLSHF